MPDNEVERVRFIHAKKGGGEEERTSKNLQSLSDSLY